MYQLPAQFLQRLRRPLLWAGLAMLLTVSSQSAPLAAAPEVPTDTPTLFVASNLTGLHVSSAHVHWFTGCGGDLYPARSFLRRAPATGSAAIQTRYHPADCASGAVASYNVATDASFVYWIEANGRVVRQPIADPALAPTELGQTVTAAVGGFPSCCYIGVDDTHLFWSEGNRILRIPKGGGTREEIRSEAGGNIFDFRAGGDGTLYYRVFGKLMMLRPAGASYSATEIADAVDAYALNSDRVFYGYALGRAYIILSARRSDLGDRQIVHASDLAGRPRLFELVADDTNLYFYDRRGTSAGGPIFRKPLAGGAAEQLTSYLTGVAQLQVGAGKLFWTDYNTGIYSLPIEGTTVAPPDGDLELTGVQINQGVQTDANEVPLIGYKSTAVRIFARSIEDSNGPWTDVVAQLQFEDSEITYQSYPLTIPTTGSNRNTLDDSFVFLLRGADTAPGTRVATISIGSLGGRPESTLSNNSVEYTFNFGPAQRLTLHGMTHGNHSNGPACGTPAPNGYVPPFSNYEAHRLFMLNVYPLSQLTVVPLPGNPLSSFDNSNCIAHQHAHASLARTLASLYPDGGEYGHMLTPEGDGYYGWCCSRDGGNPVSWGQDLRSDPGATMAHEVGHALGRPHTFEDPNYERDDMPGEPRAGSMGPFLGFRLHSIEGTPSPQVVRGETNDDIFFGDIMSYHGPMWISPYTFCRLADTLSEGAITCPSGLDNIPTDTTAATEARAHITRAGAGETYLYIAGTMDEQGQITFQPFEQLQLTGQPTAPQGEGYTLTLGTNNGPFPANGIFTFAIEPLIEDWPDNPLPVPPRHFGFYVPWNPATTVIRAYEDPQDPPLAERLVSPSTPKIENLLLDTSGEQVTGTRAVTWDAADADQDSLSYSVWYSPNNGDRWLPVHVLQTTMTSTVDFDALPGGNQALLRVLASDGVNTTEAVSAPFVVPAHDPEVMATAAVDDAGYLVMANTTAFDWEDGAIEDPNAMIWLSNWQGEVGRGPWLSSADLEPGEHLLTVNVSDSTGDSATASIQVKIRDRGDFSTVNVLPDAVATVALGGQPSFQANFPTGLVDTEVRVTLVELLLPALPPVPGLVGRVIAINAIREDGTPVSHFDAPFTLSAEYDESKLDGAAEEQLTLAIFNEEQGSWQAIPSTIDSNQNQVIAQVERLSYFALIAVLPDQALEQMYLPLTTTEESTEE